MATTLWAKQALAAATAAFVGLTFAIGSGSPAQAAVTFTNKTTANGLGDNSVNWVYVDGTTVYAATGNGLSISTDGGTSFNNKTTANGLGSNNVPMVTATTVGATTTIYAAGGNSADASGVSISTDGGANFTNSASGLGNNMVTMVFVAGSTIYASTFGGVSKSTNGGTSFTNSTSGLGSNFVYKLYVVGSTVYAATANGLAVSTDSGATFTNKTTSNGLGSNDVRGVYVVGSTVYAATVPVSGVGGGLSISTDSGATFTNKNMTNGLGSNSVYGVYVDGTNVYAATSGGLSVSTDSGATFTNETTANGLGDNAVYGVYAVGATIYAATANGLSIGTAGGGAPSTYTITFDGNGSTGGTVPSAGSFTTGGTAFSVPANTGTLVKSGYTFSGWNTAADGSGTPYAAGTSTISPSVNTILFAQWTANAPAGGGSSTPEPTPTATPTPVVVPVVAAIPPGTNANIPASGLTPGSSVLLVNGVASTVTIKPDQPVQPKSLVATGDGFTMEIAGQDASGKPLGLANNAALRLQRDNTMMVKGSGFAPNADVQVYIFSTATLLGTIRTDATGAFNGTVKVPATIEPGRHTLQVAALSTDNKVLTLSMGVVLDAPAKKVRTAKATVSFDPLSAVLTPKAKKALRLLAQKTKATATGGLAVGYVQNAGDPANNASLSKQRARVIVRFLKANGVTAPLSSRGNGALTKKKTGRSATVSVSYTN